jgi:thymidine kinase
MAAQLTLYYGCMFSGKTTALIQHISALNLKNNELIVLKPASDNRVSTSQITTHDGKKHECLIHDANMDLNEIITPYTKLIAFDEAQFFDKTFLFDVKKYLLKGIDFVAAGLDKDYLGRPFGLMPLLQNIATHQHHLKAKCEQCDSDAEFSYRKLDNKVLMLVGGKDYYEPRCQKCFNRV